MRVPAYWIKSVIRKPGTARWYFRWKNSLDGKHTPLGDELPWITYAAIDWFSHYLTHEMTIFEWGSGGSTAFFSHHAKQVVTIEHDPAWYQEVITTVTKRRYSNANIRLILPEKDNQTDVWYTSTDDLYQGFSFEKYIRAIDVYPDSCFDVVVVDGRARPGCIRQALSKIKPGGYLVLDNSERTAYLEGIRMVSNWGSKKFIGPAPYIRYQSETRIWKKPGQMIEVDKSL